jgi:hypothetical protein
MSYDLKTLRSTHLAMIEMAVQGASPQQIADATGYNVVTVRQMIRAPLFQNELAKRRVTQRQITDKHTAQVLTRAKSVLVDSAEKAAQVQVGLLASNDERVQQTAVSQILDRVFGKGQDRGTTVNVTLGAGALLTLQTALAEDTEQSAKGQSPDFVDSELVEAMAAGLGHPDDNLLPDLQAQTIPLLDNAESEAA